MNFMSNFGGVQLFLFNFWGSGAPLALPVPPPMRLLSHPDLVKVLTQSMYVDDVVFGADTE